MSELFSKMHSFNSEKPLILVVEDNDDYRSILYEIFSDTYQVIEANNGKSGLEKALEFMPELIVTDNNMPIMGGLEMCKMLKMDIRTSHIPLLMLSSIIHDDLIKQSSQIGVEDYIAKPFNIDFLLEKVQSIFNKVRYI